MFKKIKEAIGRKKKPKAIEPTPTQPTQPKDYDTDGFVPAPSFGGPDV